MPEPNFSLGLNFEVKNSKENEQSFELYEFINIVTKKFWERFKRVDIRKPFQNHSSLRVSRTDWFMLALLATAFSMAWYKIATQPFRVVYLTQNRQNLNINMTSVCNGDQTNNLSQKKYKEEDAIPNFREMQVWVKLYLFQIHASISKNTLLRVHCKQIIISACTRRTRKIYASRATRRTRVTSEPCARRFI